MNPSIEAVGVTKRFGKTVALAGLDLVAEEGQVLAVLGPNGAGKTTFVRAVVTLVRPDGGVLTVGGHDVRRQPEVVRGLIGLAAPAWSGGPGSSCSTSRRRDWTPGPAVHVHLERLRAGDVDAGLAPVLRRQPADHHDGQRGAGAHPGERGGGHARPSPPAIWERCV